MGAWRPDGAYAPQNTNLNHANWVNKTNVTTTANQAKGPDGSNNGWAVVTAASGVTDMVFNFGAVGAANQILSQWCIVKKGTADWHRYRIQDGVAATPLITGFFNLGTGEKGNITVSGSPTPVSTSLSVIALGDGWFLINITGNLVASTTYNSNFRAVLGNGNGTTAPSATTYWFATQINVSPIPLGFPL
jgi:hypothetical protein